MISPEIIRNLLSQVFTAADLPLPNQHRGKVRDSYALPDQQRLLITTDRLSAFDRILGHVPYKGQVLNQLSAWWFAQTQDIIPNHFIALPDPNALLASDARPIPVEVIVRGYMTGVTSTSLWQRYAAGERHMYGYDFPEGMNKNQPLPCPMITPTTKGVHGQHDEQLTCAEVITKGLLNAEDWQRIQSAALDLFAKGQAIAEKAGLLLVDTKYEFGYAPDGQILLIDEIHTPDSSRYWLADNYQARFAQNLEPENLDKEFIRLAYAEKGYRGNGEPPIMPEELWITASQRYIQSYEMLTGTTFVPGSYPVMPRLQANLQKAGII